jgi:hypothetical protein
MRSSGIESQRLLSQADIQALAEMLAPILAPLVAREVVRLQRAAEDRRLDAEYEASLPHDEFKKLMKRRFDEESAKMRERCKVDPEYRKRIVAYQEEQIRQADERRVARVNQKLAKDGDGAFLTGNEVAAYLQGLGVKSSGSPFTKSGNRPIYRKRDVDAWIERKPGNEAMGPPRPVQPESFAARRQAALDIAVKKGAWPPKK